MADPNGWTAALTIAPRGSWTRGSGVASSISEVDGGTAYFFDTTLGAPVAFWRLVVHRVP